MYAAFNISTNFEGEVICSFKGFVVALASLAFSYAFLSTSSIWAIKEFSFTMWLHVFFNFSYLSNTSPGDEKILLYHAKQCLCL